MMQIVNDKKSEEEKRQEEPQVSAWGVAGYGLLSGVAISTFFLGPLPIVLAHLRLPQPWPKFVALLGAVLALTVFQAPLIPVVLVFVGSLVLGDAVSEGLDFWSALLRVVPVCAGVAVLALVVLGSAEGAGPLAYWETLTGRVIAELQKSVQVPEGFDWAAVQQILRWEGPFLYLAGVVLSSWVSVGLAAHFRWIPESLPCGAEGLRRLRLPSPMCWLGAVGFAVLAITGPKTGLFSGAIRLLGAVLFVQGAVCLSVVMQQRGAVSRLRTLIYLGAISLGFYALVGLGVISPWFFRRQGTGSRPLPRTLEEGV